MAQANSEGGKILFGERVLAGEHPNAYYVQPGIALMPKQTDIMHKETFAPLIFVTKYSGGITEAIKMVNEPDNAGLVNGIYSQNSVEVRLFTHYNDAGHTVVNSEKGTGAPTSYGMGFGGQKASGENETVNISDPLEAFTKKGLVNRIAINTKFKLDR